jgi:hypothetical protein
MLMIVVVYNPTKVASDGYAQGAAKARYAIAAHSVGKMAEALEGYGDHSIKTLIIADHGASGVQGVGSGQSQDYSFGTNLSSAHIKASTAPVTGDPVRGSTAMPMMMVLMKLAADSFTSRAQAGYIAVLSRKIKVGGNLLLAGCSVGSGEDGKNLLKSLGLAVQNSIRVVGSEHETSWTDTTKPVIYPARYSPHRRLTPGDVIGYMGMRQLGESELQSVLDETDILSTG